MEIVADENIPLVWELFQGLGTLSLLPGREINAEVLSRADVLLVRSVTRVNSSLIRSSPVRFVGSATSATDHIDLEYLQGRGIGFCHAPGCNARSVAEYVISALVALQRERGLQLQGKRAVVVGCGHVGSLLRSMLEAAGIACSAYDPPLWERTGDPGYLDAEAIRTAEIISLHVPLMNSGPYPTRGMVDAAFLAQLRPDAVLINTSRGEVVDEHALLEFIQGHPEAHVVLDVWREEPRINRQLLSLVSIGTPHIAGYSQDGRIKAARRIHKGVCEYFGMEPGIDQSLPPAGPEFELPMEGFGDGFAAMQETVPTVYDILHDHRNLKRILDMDTQQGAACFDALRRDYRVRREFPATKITLDTAGIAVRQCLAGLGFTLVTEHKPA